MEAHKTMRKTMALVLSMAAAACGPVQPASVKLDDGDEGSGEIDMGCNVASDCPDGNACEMSTHECVALDGAGPQIALEPSTVKDERGDTIDFSNGVPVHTHAGATVDLAAAGCPVVYKYAYLMDTSIPFGISLTPNPLAWRIKVSDMELAAGSQQFRVRQDDDTVVRDWSAVAAPDTNGVSTIELTREGGVAPIAQLGTRTGKFFVDVKARDSSNNETVKSICFDHHPLQAPVDVAPFDGGSLGKVNLPTDTAAAFMINSGGQVEIAFQPIKQQTAEPTTVTWSAASTNVQYTKSTFDGYAHWATEEQVNCISGDTNPKCSTTWSPPPAAGAQSSSGSFTPTISFAVVDTETGQTVASSTSGSITVTLPARAAGQPVHEYRFVMISAAMTQLQPPSLGGAFDEYWLLQLNYTGSAPQNAGVHCLSIQQTSYGYSGCNVVQYHYRYSALDQATLAMTVSSRIQQNGSDVTYGDGNKYAPVALSWNSGNDNLPGGH